jgi:hypothetical protein
MIPHTVGIFPYVGLWVTFFGFFLQNLEDVRREDEALFERIPAFVPYAVGATVAWFSCFTFGALAAMRAQLTRLLTGVRVAVRSAMAVSMCASCLIIVRHFADVACCAQTSRPTTIGRRSCGTVH